jgi:hypothetical protein
MVTYKRQERPNVRDGRTRRLRISAGLTLTEMLIGLSVVGSGAGPLQWLSQNIESQQRAAITGQIESVMTTQVWNALFTHNASVTDLATGSSAQSSVGAIPQNADGHNELELSATADLGTGDFAEGVGLLDVHQALDENQATQATVTFDFSNVTIQGDAAVAAANPGRESLMGLDISLQVEGAPLIEWGFTAMTTAVGNLAIIDSRGSFVNSDLTISGGNTITGIDPLSASFALSNLATAVTYQIEYTASEGIPEPSTSALVLLGAACVLAIRRRRTPDLVCPSPQPTV